MNYTPTTSELNTPALLAIVRYGAVHLYFEAALKEIERRTNADGSVNYNRF